MRRLEQLFGHLSYKTNAESEIAHSYCRRKKREENTNNAKKQNSKKAKLPKEKANEMPENQQNFDCALRYLVVSINYIDFFMDGR